MRIPVLKNNINAKKIRTFCKEMLWNALVTYHIICLHLQRTTFEGYVNLKS